MSRLAQAFTRLRTAHKTALVAFVAAGDPDLATTAEEVGALARGGADIIELGVPFSDPVADGPVNQRAYQRALARGVTLGDVLDLASRVRSAVPMVLLSYYIPCSSTVCSASAQRARAPAWTDLWSRIFPLTKP